MQKNNKILIITNKTNLILSKTTTSKIRWISKLISVGTSNFNLGETNKLVFCLPK
jgi:hypothetical protein